MSKIPNGYQGPATLTGPGIEGSVTVTITPTIWADDYTVTLPIEDVYTSSKSLERQGFELTPEAGPIERLLDELPHHSVVRFSSDGFTYTKTPGLGWVGSSRFAASLRPHSKWDDTGLMLEVLYDPRR
jgi:hypothetical protein